MIKLSLKQGNNKNNGEHLNWLKGNSLGKKIWNLILIFTR